MSAIELFKKWYAEHGKQMRELDESTVFLMYYAFEAGLATQQSAQRATDGLCEHENLTFVDNPAICPVCKKRRH